MPLIPSLLESANPLPGESVLDIGCGTGVVAREIALLIGPTGHVVGLDLSADMLAVAREISVREGLEIEWVETDAREIPFPGETFDLALCQQTLQFVPDKLAVLKEIRRVLKPDTGRLILNVWLGLEHHPFPRRFYETLGAHLDIPRLDQAYSLGNESELVDLVKAAGFQDVSVTVVQTAARFPDPDGYIPRQVASSVASNPAIQRVDGAERTRLVEAVERAMKPEIERFRQGDYLVLDQFAYLLHARQ